ncbi:MAG: SUMF1/EgtB/PvdO family nonheme iron enzyme [Cyanobacteria bacterium P01_A01_bin.3]
MMGRSKRTKVFISYSHKDAASLERLQVHLKPLERQGIVDRWDDTKILAGQDWEAEIKNALSEARVAILLVSADFLASSFIVRDELPPILLAQRQEGLVVLPVILKPCRFKRTPTLNKFQSVNPPSKPLLGLKEIEQESIWVKLGDRVEDILDETDEVASVNVGIEIEDALDSSVEPNPSNTPEPSNPIPVSLVDVRDLKLEAMRAEIVGDIGEAMELWRRILAKVPFEAEAVGQLTRLGQLSGTAKLDSSQPVEPENFSENLGGGVTLEMVAIPGGGFWMGSPEREEGRDKYGELDQSLANVDVEGPQHRVALEPFCLGMYSVTQAQWMEVAAMPKVEVEMKPQPSNFFGLDCPVERISWYEAVEFCKRLSRKTGKNYRLPSEAEWEYACRAGSITPFSFGETISTDLANYNGNSVYGKGKKGEYRERTTPVGSFKANAFGLYDMHGNVWEWCADWWHKNYDGAPPGRTPWIKDGEDLRVLRGGSWGAYPMYCRSASRVRKDPDNRSLAQGFRVACSPASRSS